MADNARCYSRPSWCFLIGSVRHRMRCLHGLRESLLRVVTLPTAGSTPSARARTPIHGSRYAGGKHRHSAYRSGICGQAYIAVVKPAAPVTFNAMAGMGAPVPAQIIINLGIAEPGGQVEALQALMNIFMDADAAADVLGQTTPQGMVDAIRRHF